jgi:hypothetical protein
VKLAYGHGYRSKEANNDGRIIFTHFRHRQGNIESSDHKGEAGEGDSYGGVDNAREVSRRMSHLANDEADLFDVAMC